MIKLQDGVDACHKALGRCFFVATRAVCLPAAKEPLDGFMFEACRKLQGIEQSYSIAYPARIILQCSRPGMVCMKATWISAGREELMPWT